MIYKIKRLVFYQINIILKVLKLKDQAKISKL